MAELFRYEYAARSVPSYIGGAIALVLTAVTLPTAIAVAVHKWQGGGVLAFDVAGLFLVAGLCSSGALAWTWGWWNKVTWSLGITDEILYYTSHKRRREFPCSSIAAIEIRSSDARDSMDITMSDGVRSSVPAPCLGDLDRLCEVLGSRFPRIHVTCDGVAKC